jgi:hypothetical protein
VLGVSVGNGLLGDLALFVGQHNGLRREASAPASDGRRPLPPERGRRRGRRR